MRHKKRVISTSHRLRVLIFVVAYEAEATLEKVLARIPNSVGNKILTSAQNRLLGSHLSEFHSGFRAYRVAALAKIPFGYNSNVFHFDTEIIMQLMLTGQRIVEVPIPTYYGEEICRVNGLKYAKDVVLTTIASRLHGLQIFLRPKVRRHGAGQYSLQREARLPLVAHGRT